MLILFTYLQRPAGQPPSPTPASLRDQRLRQIARARVKSCGPRTRREYERLLAEGN